MTEEKILIGKRGERIARDYLRAKGFQIIATNFRCVFGEIDIIAKLNQLLIFVEVKTRSSDRYGAPYEAVNWAKFGNFSRSARLWSTQYNMGNLSQRLDIISIVLTNPPKIEHLENIDLA